MGSQVVDQGLVGIMDQVYDAVLTIAILDEELPMLEVQDLPQMSDLLYPLTAAAGVSSTVALRRFSTRGEVQQTAPREDRAPLGKTR